MSADYELGQRVRFTTHLERKYVEMPEMTRKWWKKWMPVLDHKGALAGSGEGIIIGRRKLVNGENQYNGYDEPITFVPKEYVDAWLVAFDLRRKPVHVLPEHLTAIE